MNPLTPTAVEAPPRTASKAVAAPPSSDEGAAPAPPARVTAPSGLAIGAVVVGAGALLVSAVPFVNVVSVLGGIAAVVLGIVVLRRLAPGAAGRGLAVAAVVLGGLATAVAAAVLLVVGMLVITADRITVQERGSEGFTVEELGPEEFADEAGEPIDADSFADLP